MFKKTTTLNASKRALLYLIKQNWQIFAKDTLLVVVATIPVSLITLVPANIARSAFDGNSSQLLINLVLLFILGGIHGIIWHQADLYYVKHVYPLFYSLGEKTFKYVLGKEYPEFIAQSPSKIAQYSNELRDNVDRIWSSVHWGYIGFATQVPAIILISLRVSWIQSLIYLVGVIIMVVALSRRSVKLNDLLDKLYTQDNELSSSVIDSITNFVNVKSFRAESKELKQHAELRKKSEKKYDEAMTSYMKYWFAASKLIRYVTWPAILASTYFLFKNGSIDGPKVVLAITALLSLTEFVWGLVDRIANAKRNFSKLQNGYDYLAGEENILLNEPSFKTISDLHFKHTIELRNLSFAYPDRPEKNVLENINLTIYKNEKIGIVGKSGGGKSTFVKLLLGFYNFPEGTVLVDGQPVTKAQLATLNSYVPQDTSLFQQTIFHNIAYAYNGIATKKDVVDAAKKAHADMFISKLKHGYETMVGERGIKLSLGQRQRIAIARAFLKDSNLLILDEATSALDSKTESEIQVALEELWKNRTVIAIAHRLSTLNNVDRIIVIDEGKIAEEGTKTSLLKSNGKFASLWHQQKNGLL